LTGKVNRIIVTYSAKARRNKYEEDFMVTIPGLVVLMVVSLFVGYLWRREQDRLKHKRYGERNIQSGLEVTVDGGKNWHPAEQQPGGGILIHEIGWIRPYLHQKTGPPRSRSSLIVELAVLVSKHTGVPVDQIAEQTPLGPEALNIRAACARQFGKPLASGDMARMTFGELRTQLFGS